VTVAATSILCGCHNLAPSLRPRHRRSSCGTNVLGILDPRPCLRCCIPLISPAINQRLTLATPASWESMLDYLLVLLKLSLIFPFNLFTRMSGLPLCLVIRDSNTMSSSWMISLITFGLFQYVRSLKFFLLSVRFTPTFTPNSGFLSWPCKLIMAVSTIPTLCARSSPLTASPFGPHALTRLRKMARPKEFFARLTTV
jgi:hypothetical protein